MGSSKVIDLHVHSFMRNTSGFSAYELQELSLERLQEALDQGLRSGLSELQVIHGKGKGILKERCYACLEDYLRRGKIMDYTPSFFNEDTVIVRFPL